MIKTILISFFSFIIIEIFAQGFHSISGSVADSATHEPLAYCSIGLHGTNMATIANEEGHFNFKIPDSLLNLDIHFNYIGHYEFQKQASELSRQSNFIILREAPKQISEVIIRPFKPEDILRRAVARIKENYASHPYISNGFYREMLKENEDYVQFIEAFISTYNFPYEDTTKSQVKLLQGRTRDDLQSIKFMHKEFEKHQKMIVRRARKKGANMQGMDSSFTNIGLGGPKQVLLGDPVKYVFHTTDTNMFYKFKYAFDDDNILGNHELYAIAFQSKKSINYVKLTGVIYIDKKSYAIIRITAKGIFEMPVVFRPVFFLVGFSIKDMIFNIENEYKEANNIWYLQKIILKGGGTLEKRRMGRENDLSNFRVEQAFVSTDAQFDNVCPFPKEEQLNNEPLSKQLGKYDPDFWATHNKIEFEAEH